MNKSKILRHQTMEYYRGVKWNELQKIYPHDSVLKFYTERTCK